ncbi:hypothetical protein STRNTR1_2428 [Stenotrophomonas maltophilia]|nr:hypothetical protein STRNTR1_2428 [Stenotrophomonas maltophilia]
MREYMDVLGRCTEDVSAVPPFSLTSMCLEVHSECAGFPALPGNSGSSGVGSLFHGKGL